MNVKVADKQTEDLDEAAGLTGTSGERTKPAQGSSHTKKPEGNPASGMTGSHGERTKPAQGSSHTKKPEGSPANGMTGSSGERTKPAQGSSHVKVPGSKVGMINAMVELMSGMRKDELYASFGKMRAAAMNEQLSEDEEDNEITVKTNSVELEKIKQGDIDITEDISAMFAGDDTLSEEFKSKAATIFEAAVIAKVNEQLQKVTIDLETEVEAARAQIEEQLATKLNDYLEYVVEEWLEENRLAVEQGLKTEIVEQFIGGLKDLFVEHHIDVPEESEDIVESLVERAEELEAKLNAQIEESVELKKQIDEYKKLTTLADVSESLTDTQKEKLKVLAEGIEFENVESYTQKLNVIKESYFKEAKALNESASTGLDEEPVEDGTSTEKVPQHMQAYMSAISRTVKK